VARGAFRHRRVPTQTMAADRLDVPDWMVHAHRKGGE
jgi:hypothetical protein